MRRFTKRIYKSTEDLSISLFICKFEVGSKLDKDVDNLSMIR